LGSLIVFKARMPGFTLLESMTPPGKSPPPFVHHEQDTLVCVIEGEYEISGERLPEGSCTFIPKGTVHAVSVAGSEAGRCLVILTPPGPAERFFEEVGVPCANGDPFAPPEDAPDMKELSAIARRHGIELLVTPV
jgi:mannose-6-phosphate isomerase-like protein (cupin superfamily)